MARISLVFTLAFTVLVRSSFAVDSPNEVSQSKTIETPATKKQTTQNKEESESLKKAIRSLSPEQKQRLAENVKAWKQLSPEQKEALRQRELQLKKQATEEVANVTAELPESQRETFLQRYMEERRKLQIALRQEIEAKRKTGLSELLQRLKTEMSEAAPPQPASTAPVPNP